LKLQQRTEVANQRMNNSAEHTRITRISGRGRQTTRQPAARATCTERGPEDGNRSRKSNSRTKSELRTLAKRGMSPESGQALDGFTPARRNRKLRNHRETELAAAGSAAPAAKPQIAARYALSGAARQASRSAQAPDQNESAATADSGRETNQKIAKRRLAAKSKRGPQTLARAT
jgi:hypothetical protein